ncbi:MAG TPA: IS66 family insertion sequence element accessory protein TnpB [Burkholderiales bacterium]|nr:IS66 family insertion sequence element accessory protein TnpB [Burkholderiales bacterium]
MLSVPGTVKIFLCLAPTDMRKSIDGLAGLASTVLEQDPLSGHLFVFTGKRRDRVKLLYFDGDGYAVWYKRLELGVFRLPEAGADQTSVTLSAAELTMLLSGVDLASVRRTKRYRRAEEQVPA